MKNHIFYFIAAAMLVACAPPQEGGLAELTAKRDSLKTEYSRIGAEISEIETQITAMDTTARLPYVTTMNVTKGEFKHYFNAQGNVSTDLNVQIFPETQGIVKAINIQEGKKVSKGQTILELDNEMAKASLKELEANYELANEVFKRQEKLWEQNIGSEIQYLEAKSRKESLESSLVRAREAVNMTKVTAPFSGVVDEITLKVGEMASPAMPICRVVNLDDMYIKADVSEGRLADVKEGMMVEVIAGGQTMPAKITRIGNYIKSENRTFQIRVDLTEKSDVLRPNMFATLRINHVSIEDAISLPAYMVRQDAAGGDFVWIVRKENDVEVAYKKVVETGVSNGDHVVIVSGLDGSEKVIDKGARKAQDDQPVTTTLKQN